MNSTPTDPRDWVTEQLLSGRKRNDIARELVLRGAARDIKTARSFVASMKAHVDGPFSFWALIESFWPVLGLVVFLVLFVYGSVVGFMAGKDGCVYGPATETRCGFEVVGTAKGKIFGYVVYGPGYLLGTVFAGEQD